MSEYVFWQTKAGGRLLVDISRIADSLERIADSVDQRNDRIPVALEVIAMRLHEAIDQQQ